MLVLFETAAGYAIFKLLDEKVLKKPDEIFKNFQTVESANETVKLLKFVKFEDTTQALAAATALIEGKMSSDLKKVSILFCCSTLLLHSSFHWLQSNSISKRIDLIIKLLWFVKQTRLFVFADEIESSLVSFLPYFIAAARQRLVQTFKEISCFKFQRVDNGFQFLP